MATVICFKSESSDTYMFIADKVEYSSVETLVEGLSKEWYVEEEPLYVEEVISQDFDTKELRKKVNTLLENIEIY
ncbi:hypothetical protein VP249E411_P0205 [Vibrio phage 249E41-1]|nr:hypothetical protein VP249E411_P0205 [Vibrio phage 249E41-1]